MAVNQHGFGRVKVQIVLSCLFTISATLTFSCNHRNPVHLSLSLSRPVSLSVYLIGVQHPPTSCQERAPLRSSKPANYCLGRFVPRGPSQTSRTSLRALPWPPGDGEGKAGQTPGPLPLPSSPRLHLNGSDKLEQLKATRFRGEGQSRGGEGNVRRGGQERR